MKPIRTQSILDNGIIVATDYAPHFNSVKIEMNFRIGSMHEPDEKSGLAHLLEHMLFRGSRTRSSEVIQKAFSGSGGWVNGTTRKDSTSYHALVLKRDIEQAVDVLADIVTSPLLDKEHLALEKDIIEQEGCRGCFNCNMDAAFLDIAYPEQSVRLPVIGYQDTVESISVEDLRHFHTLAYVGRNLSVLFAGDIQHEDAVKLVKTYLGALPAGTAAGYPELDFQVGDAIMNNSSEQSAVRFGYPVPKDLTKKEQEALYLAVCLLGVSPRSLLVTELREKRGLVYSVNALIEDFAGNKYVEIELHGDAAKFRDIITLTAQAIRNVCGDAITSDECGSIKREVEGWNLMWLDDVSHRPEPMREQIIADGTLADWEEVEAINAELTKDDLRAVAKKVFEQEPTLVGVGPVRHMLKAEEMRSILRGEATKEKAKSKSMFKLVG